MVVRTPHKDIQVCIPVGTWVIGLADKTPSIISDKVGRSGKRASEVPTRAPEVRMGFMAKQP